MTTQSIIIYIVQGLIDFEGAQLLKAFKKKPAAKKFQRECEEGKDTSLNFDSYITTETELL